METEEVKPPLDPEPEVVMRGRTETKTKEAKPHTGEMTVGWIVETADLARIFRTAGFGSGTRNGNTDPSRVSWPGAAGWKPESRALPMTMSPAESSLLDAVLRHHYDALALLCKDVGDATRNARGMLLAGYAYGRDHPVSNITTNARWYNAVFPVPAGEEVQVRMLSCKAMFRLACRSLDALFAFMRAYAPALSTQETLAYLTRTDGHLLDAIELLRAEGVHHAATMDDAFRAAISAARLPSEAARRAHLHHVLATHESAQPLDDKHDEPAAMLEPASPLSRGASRALSNHIHHFRMEEGLCLAIVYKALHKLGKHYELHMTCGNNLVLSSWERSIYHVNFLASPKGGSNVPTLFFAEVRAPLEDVNDVRTTFCCPVTGGKRTGVCFAGACFTCEYNGMKLIHPVDVKFNGQLDLPTGHDPNLDKWFRKDPTTYFDAPLGEDYLFFEADRHPEVANFLEAAYSGVSDDRIDLSFVSFGG